jgi:outer membrane protein
MTRIATFALCAAAVLALAGPRAFAQQKIAYVDIAAVMKAIPDAQEAQRKLDDMVDKWQKELEGMQNEWQQKYNDYDKRKLILTDQGRVAAEKELQDLDRRILEYRDKKFGQSGELFTKEDELMKPIQNLVFDQVKQYAVENGFDFILDKSSGVSIIYAKDSWDITQKIIERIQTTLPARSVSGQPGGQPGGQAHPPEADGPGGLPGSEIGQALDREGRGHLGAGEDQDQPSESDLGRPETVAAQDRSDQGEEGGVFGEADEDGQGQHGQVDAAGPQGLEGRDGRPGLAVDEPPGLSIPGPEAGRRRGDAAPDGGQDRLEAKPDQGREKEETRGQGQEQPGRDV